MAYKSWTNLYVLSFFLMGITEGITRNQQPVTRKVVRPSLASRVIGYCHLFRNLFESFNLIIADFALWAYPGVPVARPGG